MPRLIPLKNTANCLRHPAWVAVFTVLGATGSLQADVKKISASAPSAAGVWVNAAHWEGSGAPTAADDVVFDWAYNETLSQVALQTGTGPFTANSITFGSASGLGTFSFLSGNSGTTARTLTLTSGAITVTSHVTGAQAFGNSGSGILTLVASDGSFEINNHSSQTLNLDPILSDGTGGTSVTYGGTGLIVASRASTYTGGTTLLAGATVRIGNTASLGVGGALAVGSGATLDLANVNNVTVAGLNDVNGVGGTVGRSTTGGVRNLILAGAGSYSFSGTFAIDGTASNFAVQITGGGVHRFSGASTHGGVTTVTNGTLLANNLTGSATGSGNVSVGASGVLGGTGTIASASSSASTARFSPGDGGAGTFTLTGNFNVSNGAVFDFELGSVSDRISVGGTFTGSSTAGGMVFDFTGGAGIATGVAYTLFDYGSISGLDASDFALSSASITAGFVLDSEFGSNGWLIDTTNQLVQVRFSEVGGSVIPEPSSAALFAGLLISGAAIMRRSVARGRK